jgi:branched-chain amino acid transport system substrate-binding protein
MAVEQLNANGGINGQPIEILYEDDQMSPKVATNAIQKLSTADKVPVILGAFGSTVTLAIAPIAERNKIVLLSASSTADKIRDAGDYIFRNVPPNARQAQTASDFCLAGLHAHKAAILAMNNDYGVSLRDEFLHDFKVGGGTIVASETYNPASTDYRTQLVKIGASKPDVIFFPGHYQESASILKQAVQLGIKTPFIGGDGSYSPDLIKVAGTAAEGSYYTMMAMGYGSADKEISSFTTAFKRKYGEEPGVYSAYAYDAVNLIADAVKRGGYTADGIKRSLYETKNFKGVTGITRFDSNGEVDKPFYIYQVKSGTFSLSSWRPGGKH